MKIHKNLRIWSILNSGFMFGDISRLKVRFEPVLEERLGQEGPLGSL